MLQTHQKHGVSKKDSNLKKAPFSTPDFQLSHAPDFQSPHAPLGVCQGRCAGEAPGKRGADNRPFGHFPRNPREIPCPSRCLSKRIAQESCCKQAGTPVTHQPPRSGSRGPARGPKSARPSDSPSMGAWGTDCPLSPAGILAHATPPVQHSVDQPTSRRAIPLDPAPK